MQFLMRIQTSNHMEDLEQESLSIVLWGNGPPYSGSTLAQVASVTEQFYNLGGPVTKSSTKRYGSDSVTASEDMLIWGSYPTSGGGPPITSIVGLLT